MKLFAVLLLPLVLVAEPPRPLFNGKNLDGWQQQGPHQSFYTAQGEIRTSGKGQVGNWIYTSEEYQNFRLTFEYKLAQWAEAAVVVRAPRSDRPQHAGLTVVLAHDFHNETTPYITGAIMGAAAPAKTFPPSFEKWHRVEIEARGVLFKVTIDEVVVQDLDLSRRPELAHRLPFGVIGFPDMGYAYAVRSLEIEVYDPTAKIIELAPQDSLENWGKRGDSGEWRVEDGLVEGMNGHSILYAPEVFADLEFTALVRTHNRVNAGVFLRGSPEGANRGFEVQIYSPVDAVYQTGSIYGRQRSSLQADLEERWFSLQIRVRGARCTVWVDGMETADFERLPAELQGPGRIGLQIHSDDGRVEFRDLRVRTL